MSQSGMGRKYGPIGGSAAVYHGHIRRSKIDDAHTYGWLPRVLGEWFPTETTARQYHRCDTAVAGQSIDERSSRRGFRRRLSSRCCNSLV